MPIVVSIVSQKGGVGKSSIAQGLAALYDDTCPPSAVLIDGDPQRTTTEWFEQRPQHTPELHTVGGRRELDAVIRSQQNRNRIIVIDTAPTIDDFIRSVVRRSNFVLIPCGMGAFDLDAVRATVEMARKMGKPHQVILTRVPATRGGAVAPLVVRARQELRAEDIGVWPR